MSPSTGSVPSAAQTRSSERSNAHPSPKPTPASGRFGAWCHRHRRFLLATLIIALIEICVFNLGFWRSLASPAPLPAAQTPTSIGSGLKKTPFPQIYTLTDAAHGYIEISVHNAKVATVNITPTQAKPPQTDQSETGYLYKGSAPDFQWWSTVRIDTLAAGSSQWVHGTAQNVSPAAPASTLLSNDADSHSALSKVRVWFLQPEGASCAYSGVRLNVRPSFGVNLIRVAFMALVAAFIIGFRPGSRLYRTRLNTSSTVQRWILVGSLVPFAAIFVAVVIGQWGYAPSNSWNNPGEYTYDADQYARMADSLFKGHPWLDLPVPKALAAANNPYSTQTRAQLLSQGTTPIFWDHAFWNGHWYSYFGVLPAAILYLPYHALTSLWIPGGASLPTPDVVTLLLALFALTSALLVVRLIEQYFPSTSLGMAILSVIGFLSAANLFFLAFRLTFYVVPMLSSLVLTTLGLWLWLSARRAGEHSSTHLWTLADGSPDDLILHKELRLSRVRLGFGSLCMAANLGCRPTFVLAVFLAFPLFWPQIKAGLFFSYARPRAWKNHADLSPQSSVGNDAAAVLPAIAICLPVLAYNYWRFGSFFDFGNTYQLTVTDLTTYREPANLIAPITYYYLFQPPSLTTHFPLMKLTSTPLQSWQLTEPHPGGFFWLVPFALLGLAALFMHKRLAHHHLWGLSASMLGLAVVLCVFDAYKAGLSWRYTADFGWLIGLVAVTAACALEEWGQQRRDGENRSAATATSALSGVHTLVAVLVGIGLVVTILTFLMPGRIDNLMSNYSQIYFEVRGWLTGWLV